MSIAHVDWKPGIDAVVVNYKTPTDLERFIESFERSQGVYTKLHVMNVQPMREDLDVGWAAQERGHRHHWFEENVGYARACNTGASFPIHDVVAFFNADTVLQPDTLKRCRDHLVGHEDWAVVGPRQVNSAGKLTHAGIFGSDDAPKHRAWLQNDHPDFHDVRDDCYSVSGSAYFVKRDAWIQMYACPVYRKVDPETEGAFLTTKLYYEESWFSAHCRSHGWKVAYVGDGSAMVHEWHQSVNKYGGDHLMAESRVRYNEACDAHGIAHE